MFDLIEYDDLDINLTNSNSINLGVKINKLRNLYNLIKHNRHFLFNIKNDYNKISRDITYDMTHKINPNFILISYEIDYLIKKINNMLENF